MKMKYILPVLLGAFALFTGCTDDDSVTLLDQVQVSSSYVAIPQTGGSATITLKAQADWAIEKVVSKKDSLKWLTISAESGKAGEVELTFTAPSSLDGRMAQLLINCGSATQRVNIVQGEITPTIATCADVIAGPVGKKYRVTGICTAISNFDYGNWYLTDKTGQVYIYGTLDKNEKEKNFKSLNIEVGDEITVEGPKELYNTIVELKNVTVVKIEKSLIKVDSVKNSKLPAEGGEATVYLTCKGQGVSFEIPSESKPWLSISSIKTVGTTSVYVFKAEDNNAAGRTADLTFTTTDGKKEYTTKVKLTQPGAIYDATVAEFLAVPVSTRRYRLKGTITKVQNENKGNFDLKDATGEVYVYSLKSFKTKHLKVGDQITIVGQRGDYKGKPQMVSPELE